MAMELTGEIVLRPMQSQADADAFRALNEEWIAKWFRFEDKDRAALSDPHGTYIAPGGQIYMALRGADYVGTAALIRYRDDLYELSKMAVAPAVRGQGVGRKLLAYTIEQARSLGALTVFLGSSTKLTSAVHLYESFGFRHVPPSDLPEIKYDRADVFMKLAFDRALAQTA